MTLKSVMALIMAAVPAMAGGDTLPADPTTSDVCALVPGEQVATALRGQLVEGRLVRPGGSSARCVYVVSMGAQSEPAAFVLWLHAAADFDELRGYQDDPWQPVMGLGDEAFISFHPEDGRHDLYVLLADLATIEVTGPDPDSVRAVAATAIARLRPEAPAQ